MKLFFRLMSVLFALVIVAGGIYAGVQYGTHTWTRNGCFTVNYVDLRAGYAPAGVYTSIGVIDDYSNDNIGLGEIGKWKSGDSYCGPITYGVGQIGGIVFFGPRVNTSHAVPGNPFAPTAVGDGP